MKNGLVSIVLPIYNVERYLCRCLESVVNQTYTNLEIILVDDGSPDRCSEICEEWKDKDQRIKVIHKENAGLGMARNTGIENATGEYICFFDSDDFVALDTIEKCYYLAQQEASDIVVYGISRVRADGKINSTIIPHTDHITYSGKEVQDSFLPDLIAPNTATGRRTDLWISAWSSFYSMKLINRCNWKFVSEREIISEDIYSLLYLYKEVKRVSVLSEALYFYCENDGSLTHTYREDRYDKIKYFYDQCIEAASACGYGQEVKTRLSYPYLSNTIAALKMIVSSSVASHEKKKDFYKNVKDPHLNYVLRKYDITHESIGRKILINTIRKKWYGICYLLVKIKT